MRDLLRRMQPTGFDDIVAVLALYRPGPMGMNAHNDYADRKNGRQADQADPPGARGAAAGDPRRDLRPDRLPRADHAHRAEGRRLLDGPRPTCCARPWARRSSRCSRRSTRASREGMKANGFSEAAVKALWDTILPFAGYAFNKSHAAGYGLVSYWTAYLKANYPGRVHGRPAHLGRRRQGQGRGLPGRLPPARHHGAAAGRQRVGAELRLGRRRHPLRAGRGAQRRRQRRCLADQHAHREGQVHRLLRLPQQDRHRGLQQEGHRVADQGRRVRLARASRARACSWCTPTPSTRCWAPRRPRRWASSTCSAAPTAPTR